MVGYEFLDHDAIGESHIGISVADAADYTKSESDVVLTQPAMVHVSLAVQISRKTCQMIKSYAVGHSDAFIGLFLTRYFVSRYKWILTCVFSFSADIHCFINSPSCEFKS